MSEDKWLDELLDKTEKEEILDAIKRALTYLDDLDVRKAYNVLELLSHSLDGYDVGKQVEEYEGYVEKVPAVPRVWSTGGTPPRHHHQIDHGTISSYAHDHTLANLDEHIEEISHQTVQQVINDLMQRMDERDKELAEMQIKQDEISKMAEEKLAEIDADTAIYERITGIRGVAAPMPEQEEPDEDWKMYLERALKYKEARLRGDNAG